MSIPIPLGWRFSPTKVEIITMLNSPNNRLSLSGIAVYDVFGELTPTELFQATASNNNNTDDRIGRYFYTPLKRLKKDGNNIKRTVEKLNESTQKLECVGTWEAGTAPDRIYDPKTGSLIGESRFYTFVGSDDDHWLMTAFCLAGDSVKDKDPNSDLFSICKIYKKAPKKRDDTLPTASNHNQQQQSQSMNPNPATESEVEKNTFSGQFDQDLEMIELMLSNYDYSYENLSSYMSPVQSSWSNSID